MDRRKFLTLSGTIGSLAVGGCSGGPEISATNTNALEPQSEKRTSEGWIDPTEIPDGYTIIHISDSWEVVPPEETKDWDSDTVARFRRGQCKRYFVYEHIPEQYEIFSQGQCTEGVVITVEDNSGRVVAQISLPEKNPDQPDSTSESEPDMEVVSSELLTDERGRKWVRGEFQNIGDVDHGRYRVNYNIRDDEDRVVDSQQRIIDIVPTGERWLDYTIVLGNRREAAASVDVDEITTDGETPPPEAEDVNILSSRLNKDYQGVTEVVGELENTGSERSLYLTALIRTADGVLRGSVGTFLPDIPAGGTRTFRAALATHWTPRNREDDLPTEHEIYIFEAPP
jgi:hypothetical protein